jgi:hypothetical protein
MFRTVQSGTYGILEAESFASATATAPTLHHLSFPCSRKAPTLDVCQVGQLALQFLCFSGAHLTSINN